MYRKKLIFELPEFQVSADGILLGFLARTGHGIKFLIGCTFKCYLQPRPQGAFPWLWVAREKRPGDEVVLFAFMSSVHFYLLL